MKKNDKTKYFQISFSDYNVLKKCYQSNDFFFHKMYLLFLKKTMGCYNIIL